MKKIFIAIAMCSAMSQAEDNSFDAEVERAAAIFEAALDSVKATVPDGDSLRLSKLYMATAVSSYADALIVRLRKAEAVCEVYKAKADSLAATLAK